MDSLPKVVVPAHLKQIYESSFSDISEEEFLQIINTKFIDAEDPLAGKVA
jgi:hypothetical protein